jgi:hypothetical protein
MTALRIDGGIPTLAAALFEHMHANELKKLASLTSGPVPARKAELADLIAKHLEGNRLRAVWQSLDELQKAAVAEVVHSPDTQFPVDRFHAKYGRAPSWGSLDTYRRAERPSALRFFFYGGEGGGGVMPDDLKERLKALVPPPASATVKSLAELPAVYERPWERWNLKTKKKEHGTESIPLTVRESERAAPRELFSVLRLVDAGKVAVSDKTRRASSSTIDAITAVLEGGDYYPYRPPKDKWSDENAGPIRAFAWPLIIQAGGLAQLSGPRLQLTKAGRKALGEPAAETLRSLWEKWTDTTVLDELSRVECVKGQTGKGKYGLTAVASRREAIAATLAECPPQQWIAADELLRYVRASGNDFAVSRNAWNLYIGELQYGSLGYAGAEGILETRYLLGFLFEYAATLGLIDVAFIPPAGARRDYHNLWGTDELPYFSRYDGLMFVRITPLGAYSLDMVSDYTPARVEVTPVLRVLPNLDIAAIGAALEQGDRLALDAYAVRVSDLVWRLTATKLLSATEEGRSIGEIREFLAERSSAPLPDTVGRLLEDAADRCARVHDRGLARLIECAEPALAVLIANDIRTRTHCMRAGERHLVVAAASEAAFRRALRELSYLLASGEARVTTGRRASTSDAPGPRAAEA